MSPRHPEQRTESRQRFGGLPAGVLSVHTPDRLWHVLAVRDVSANGISLCVDEPLPVGQPVTLIWRGADLRAEFIGYTAWCAPVETLPDPAENHLGRQVVGLSMHGLQQLACFLRA
jgi:hypothetical protein